MARNQPTKPTPAPVPEGKPSIFISHDSRDARLAEAFAKLITYTSVGLIEVFWSSDKKGSQGIEYGTEWFKKIDQQIADSRAVVALLTRRSVDRPWVLYETGLANGRNIKVFGLALGVPVPDATSGPLSQFHNCGGNDDEIKKLVHQLLATVPGLQPSDDIIDSQVKCFLEKLDKVLADIDEGSTALGGYWYYQVRNNNGEFSHCGDCTAEQDGEKLVFDGMRRLESGAEDSVQSKAHRMWRTSWAQICSDKKIRMQYEIALNDGRAKINCDLNIKKVNGEEELHGEFYLSPPFNKVLPNTTNGPIVFSRHELKYDSAS